MLVLVRSLSYTPRDGFSEELLLHSWYYFSLGVSLTLLMILLARCFLTHLMLVLVRCFSYTPHASFSDVFLLDS